MSGGRRLLVSPRQRWLTLAAALLGWAFDGIEMGVVPVIARPALAELLGPNAGEEAIRRWTGTLAIAFLLGAAAGGVGFGWLGDRFGRVRALALAVLCYASLTGLSALARTPAELTGLRFLAACGMGGEWALGVALVVETWPARWRPWLAGLIGAAVNVGYVGVAGLTRWLDPATQWRTILAVCAAPAALTVFVRLFVPESPAWRAAAATAPRPRLVELFDPGLRHRTLAGAAAGALFLLAVWGAVQFTQPWAAQLTGDARAAATVQGVSAGAAALGAVAAPVLLAPVSRRLGYFLLSAGALSSAEFLFLTRTRFDGVFLAGVALTGAWAGAFGGWLALYLPELFPTRLRATGQGFTYNAGRVLAAAGVAVTTFGLDVSGRYAQASALVSLAFAVGLLLAWRLPESAGEINTVPASTSA